MKRCEIYNEDCLTGMSRLAEHSVGLILADPPYYRVKGDFDFQWESREAYLADAERWALAMRRVLSYNGTLVWFCSYRMCGYLQVMLDKYFHLLNVCTVYKTNSVQNKIADIDKQRSFLVNDERILIYEANFSESSDSNPAVMARNAHRHAEGMCFQKVMSPLVEYLNAERERAGFTVAQVCKAFGMSVPSHWFSRASQWQLPTREHYARLCELFNGSPPGDFLRREYEDLRREYEDLRREYEDLRREYEDLRREYEDLRREYEDLRRPFSLPDRISDVFSVTADSGSSSRFGHPTVKDLKLITTIAATCSSPDTLILDPFMGSGTTGVAAKSLGRPFIGFELDSKYFDIAKKRMDNTPWGFPF